MDNLPGFPFAILGDELEAQRQAALDFVDHHAATIAERWRIPLDELDELVQAALAAGRAEQRLLAWLGAALDEVA